jgi:hypothetical protein
VDKAVAISRSFSVFLVATSLGGIYGGFFEIMFKIARKLNETPIFKQLNQNAVITID